MQHNCATCTPPKKSGEEQLTLEVRWWYDNCSCLRKIFDTLVPHSSTVAKMCRAIIAMHCKVFGPLQTIVPMNWRARVFNIPEGMQTQHLWRSIPSTTKKPLTHADISSTHVTTSRPQTAKVCRDTLYDYRKLGHGESIEFLERLPNHWGRRPVNSWHHPC